MVKGGCSCALLKKLPGIGAERMVKFGKHK